MNILLIKLFTVQRQLELRGVLQSRANLGNMLGTLAG
jgi:hypothetical protein